jgi:hypothetical protein
MWEVRRPERIESNSGLESMKIGSLSEISSQTQALKIMKICSLSPRPLGGEGWGEGVGF